MSQVAPLNHWVAPALNKFVFLHLSSKCTASCPHYFFHAFFSLIRQGPHFYYTKEAEDFAQFCGYYIECMYIFTVVIYMFY